MGDRTKAMLRETLLGTIVLTTAGAAVAQEPLPFDSWAAEFRDEHGLGEASPESLTMKEVLDSEIFARVELGGFDLRIPASTLESGQVAEDFKNAALLIVDVQSIWFGWRDPDIETRKQLAADFKTLQKWVKGWSAAKLGRAGGGQAGSLYDQLGAKDKVLEAQSRLRDYTRPDAETIEAVGDLNTIVFLPKRKDFLYFVAMAGWLDASKRPELWTDAALGQSQAWFDWTALVCMEYSAVPINRSQPFAGSTQNLRQPTGQAQYMADRGAALLLRKEFWRHGTHFFETALATNLVIAAVGENDLTSGEWKLEYKTSGSHTAPYTRFVPGGNPAGGILPKRSGGKGAMFGSMTEVSRWRKDLGRDFFLEALRAGQKAGAKLAAKDKDHPLRKDKMAHFELHALQTGQDFAMTAPFLGTAAEGKELPPLEFLDDYEDFFRAYRSGFVHWLQNEAGSSETESRTKFSELIAAHARRPLGSPLDDVVKEVYGVPLSAENGDQDSMEWRYLGWLAKGR